MTKSFGCERPSSFSSGLGRQVSNPKVSIVIPVYNVERFLKQCLDSVLAQTFTDYEVVCVNDGSTDSSPGILRRYAKKDNRILVIDQENGGLSAARNTGMSYARGEYIAFLDSDDYLDSQMLEKTVAKAEESHADIVIFDYWLYFDSTGELGTYRDQDIYARLSGRLFTLEEQPEMAQFIGVWDRLFRRSFLESHGFQYPVGRIYEDVTFCVETELAAKRIALLADHLYYYRRDVVGSITGNEAGNRKHKEDFLFVQRYAQDCLKQAHVSDEVWRYYAQYFMEYALMHQRQTRPRSFYNEFFKVVRSMACPHLVEMGQKGANPELALYRLFLKMNWANASWLFTKSCNQVHRVVGAVRWQIKKRKLRHAE